MPPAVIDAARELMGGSAGEIARRLYRVDGRTAPRDCDTVPTYKGGHDDRRSQR